MQKKYNNRVRMNKMVSKKEGTIDLEMGNNVISRSK